MNTAIYSHMRRRILANYLSQQMQEVTNGIDNLLLELVKKAQ